MTCQFGKGGRGDGNVTFQQIQRQFADGIDLIRVGMLQQRLTRMATALSQHLLEKGSLSPYSFHGNPSHTMTTRRYHSQHFIDNHVYERFLGHGHASDETQQGGSLVQKLSVHQVDSLVQQLQQWFPSPPHVSNETPQRHVLFHRYPSLTLDDDATRLEGTRLGTLSSLLLFRRFFGKTFLLHPVKLVFLREGFDGLRHRRCFCRSGEYCSSRHDGRMNTTRRLTGPFYAQRPSVPLVLLTFFLFAANAFLMPYPAAPLTAPKAAALLAAMAAGAKSARSGKRPPR